MKPLLMIIMSVVFVASAEAADVGVSITVGQPGFYGHIDIGDVPRPELIYSKPVVIAPPPRGVSRKPVYLHVPPGHEKKWKKHCKKYNACGQPVYFVRDGWYNDVYVPEYQARHGHRGGEHGDRRGGEHGDQGNHGHGKSHNKDHD